MDENKENNKSGEIGDFDSLEVLPETGIEHSSENTTKLCRWCSSPFPIGAKICPTCKGHQQWFWNYFGQIILVVSTCISIILLIISVANVILTKSNLDLAREEKIDAEKALKVAQTASEEALKAKDVASKAKTYLDDLSQISEANIAAVDALNDINSLRKLQVMSNGTNKKISDIAGKLLKPIIEELLTGHQMITSDYWGFNRKQDPRYFGFNEMKEWRRTEYIENYIKVPNDRRVVYVIQFLSDDKEPEDEKLVFCYSAFQIETRPDVIYELSAYIDSKAKLHKDYLFETDDYLTWLKEIIAQQKN